MVNVAPWQASAAATVMLSAFVNVTASDPLVPPTLAGTVQPLPPFVCVEKLNALTAHPEWPASTPNPLVPCPVSRAKDPT
jgi:hypothetical protein